MRWEIVTRIRCAMTIGVSLEEIHDIIMNSSDPPTEGEFFLCYKAAEILNS